MTTKIRPELLDDLLAGAKTSQEIFGPEGLLKRLTGALVERVLQTELAVHLEQEHKEAPKGRSGNRKNGSSDKTLQTDHGPIPLEIPRDRLGTFEPQLLPKHQCRLPGFEERIIALYARGISTRDIQGHLRELYHTDVSPELISQVTESVIEELSAWQSRPLERCYAVLWLDALMVKIREQGTVQNKAVYVAIGMRLDGHKEVLGLWLEGTEGAKFWMRVMTELKGRGLQDVLVACCDGLKGFPQAIEAVFPRAIVQTCVVHQVRYSLSFVSWKDRKAVVADLRAIYQASTEQQALEALEAFEQKWKDKYPMIAKSWINNWERIVPFLTLPRELRRIVYTTNTIESLNYQLRKVIKTKGHFPSDEAALKLLFLAVRNAQAAWKAPAHEWRQIFTQLVIYFGDRVTETM